MSARCDSVIGWRPLKSGKVRDLFINDAGEILLVASDRISAYDWIMPTAIPDKGRLLTQLSLFWFNKLSNITPHHVLSTNVPMEVKGRAIICKSLEIFPVECVARGYLTGSGWVEYQRRQEVCGIPLSEGLLDGSQLTEPIFTPATKAEIGEHDENISFSETAEITGESIASELRRLTLSLYSTARDYAKERGIIIADTKFEFGIDSKGQITLADEVLTPDSSRFWPAESWRPGGAQPSFDKQYLRDWLTNIGWDKQSPPPELPDEVVEKTRARYIEAYAALTGEKFQ
ncbi:MAG: phosphoribosylaminoimidazolesuccinocarboxamide synthase [Actinobacteria bacterium]|nr:phosphoribosylaminoimidazolesuccinocarboxamide synthase [Actinomycetota bacterium]